MSAIQGGKVGRGSAGAQTSRRCAGIVTGAVVGGADRRNKQDCPTDRERLNLSGLSNRPHPRLLQHGAGDFEIGQFCRK